MSRYVHCISNIYRSAKCSSLQLGAKPAHQAHGLGEQPKPSSGLRGTVGYRQWMFEDVNASLTPEDDCGRGFLMEAANLYWQILVLSFPWGSSRLLFLSCPGSREGSILDTRCRVAAKLTAEDPSEGPRRKHNSCCAMLSSKWKFLSAGLKTQGERVSFICAQNSVSHFSCHWCRKNRDLIVLY